MAALLVLVAALLRGASASAVGRLAAGAGDALPRLLVRGLQPPHLVRGLAAGAGDPLACLPVCRLKAADTVRGLAASAGDAFACLLIRRLKAADTVRSFAASAGDAFACLLIRRLEPSFRVRRLAASAGDPLPRLLVGRGEAPVRFTRFVVRVTYHDRLSRIGRSCHPRLKFYNGDSLYYISYIYFLILSPQRSLLWPIISHKILNGAGRRFGGEEKGGVQAAIAPDGTVPFTSAGVIGVKPSALRTEAP
jgi:hypothetical protein